jgi:hypothetical protein
LVSTKSNWRSRRRIGPGPGAAAPGPALGRRAEIARAGVVIRPRSIRPIVRARWRRPTAAAGEVGPQDPFTSDRPIAAEVPKEARPMFAQSHVVENDLLGVIPALWLLLVLVLTALGVVAHASFA